MWKGPWEEFAREDGSRFSFFVGHFAAAAGRPVEYVWCVLGRRGRGIRSLDVARVDVDDFETGGDFFYGEGHWD